MHLFTEYALSTGSRLKTPKLLEKFYPINSTKYLTFQASSGMASKNYDYFSDVLELLITILKKYNIDIIQLGGKEDEILPHTIRLCGLTNLAQSTYIIKRGLLHFGNDSSLIHMASCLDKPIVSVYGISPPEVCGPYFNSKSRTICLTPEFPEGQKYSYTPTEQPKMVNTINPEQIARAILELLGLKEEISCETIFIGKEYKKQLIEVIPNHLVHPQQLQNTIINLRADLLWNEEAIYANASQRPCTIVTNRPLNLDIIKQFKQNVKNILYLLEIDNSAQDLEFIKKLHESGISYVLLTHDLENINKFKLDYLDYNMIIPVPICKREEVKNVDKVGANTYFKTNKLILSNGKVYLSRAHWRADQPFNPKEKSKIIDDPEFFRDKEYFCLYNEN